MEDQVEVLTMEEVRSVRAQLRPDEPLWTADAATVDRLCATVEQWCSEAEINWSCCEDALEAQTNALQRVEEVAAERNRLRALVDRQAAEIIRLNDRISTLLDPTSGEEPE